MSRQVTLTFGIMTVPGEPSDLFVDVVIALGHVEGTADADRTVIEVPRPDLRDVT